MAREEAQVSTTAKEGQVSTTCTSCGMAFQAPDATALAEVMELHLASPKGKDCQGDGVEAVCQEVDLE